MHYNFHYTKRYLIEIKVWGGFIHVHSNTLIMILIPGYLLEQCNLQVFVKWKMKMEFAFYYSNKIVNIKCRHVHLYDATILQIGFVIFLAIFCVLLYECFGHAFCDSTWDKCRLQLLFLDGVSNWENLFFINFLRWLCAWKLIYSPYLHCLKSDIDTKQERDKNVHRDTSDHEKTIIYRTHCRLYL